MVSELYLNKAMKIIGNFLEMKKNILFQYITPDTAIWCKTADQNTATL